MSISRALDSIEYMVDNYINNNIVEYNYFDRYLNDYPLSDYFLGMRAYYMTNRVNVDTIKAFINNHVDKNPLFRKGTYTKLAESCILKMEYKNAKLQLLEESLRLDTFNTNKYVMFELYNYYTLTHNDTLAIDFLNKALIIDPEYTVGLIEKSNLLRSQGKLREGLDILDEIIKRNSYPDAFYYKSMYYVEKNDFSTASEILQSGLNKHETAELYTGLGFIYGQMEDYVKELQCYERALKLDCCNKLLFERLGWYYNDRGDYEKALMYFVNMYNSFPEKYEEDYFILINTMIILEKFDDAELFLKEYEKRFGSNLQLGLYKVICFSMKGDQVNAQAEYDRLCNTYSTDDLFFVTHEMKKWGIVIEKQTVMPTH